MICRICQAWTLTHPQNQRWLKCPTCGFTEKEKPLISLDDYTKGRDKTHPDEWTKEVELNALKLLGRVNAFLEDIGYRDVTVNSGFRPMDLNATIPGAAKSSNHTKGLAIDLEDNNGDLMNLVLKNLDKCVKYELFMEDFRYTIDWVHFQCVPPKSGHRIFIPYADPAHAPDRWNGIYDKKYNV